MVQDDHAGVSLTGLVVSTADVSLPATSQLSPDAHEHTFAITISPKSNGSTTHARTRTARNVMSIISRHGSLSFGVVVFSFLFVPNVILSHDRSLVIHAQASVSAISYLLL